MNCYILINNMLNKIKSKLFGTATVGGTGGDNRNHQQHQQEQQQHLEPLQLDDLDTKLNTIETLQISHTLNTLPLLRYKFNLTPAEELFYYLYITNSCETIALQHYLFHVAEANGEDWINRFRDYIRRVPLTELQRKYFSLP
jgi:hypothetical protein